jgi:hypothetical protein
LGQGVVTNPDFEDIAQQEYGIGHCVLQVVPPGGQGVRLRGLQVQVGEEIDTLPAGWRVQFHPASKSS